MALSIRNPEVEALVRDLASRTGGGMTEEILQALKERRERLEAMAGSRLERVQALIARCDALPVLDGCAPDEILGYSSHGAF